MSRGYFKTSRWAVAAIALILPFVASRLEAQVTEPAPTIAFLSEQTMIPAGRESTLAYRVPGAPDHAWIPAVAIADSTIVSLIEAVTVAPGCQVGFLRIHGRRVGATEIRIGAAAIRVEVRARAHTPAPLEFTSPASGAAVWGKVTIGALTQRENPESITLKLSDGTSLAPVTVTPAEKGPVRHMVFHVDFAALPEGAVTMRLHDGANDRADATLTVLNRRIAITNLIEGEAEARYMMRRPERFSNEKLSIGRDDQASGGKCFVNASSDPTFCFPVDVPAPGLYQVVLVARGSLAGGAFPTVGIVVDGADSATTNGRLVSDRWERLAIGLPIMLQAGERILACRFENDFYAPNLADRNLSIDRIEVARVGEAPAGESGGDGEMSSMAMMGAMQSSMMMMQASGAPEARADVEEDFLNPAPTPLRIAFSRPMHALDITGETVIEGSAWWPGRDGERFTDPPTVSLHINGRVFSSMVSAGPRFVIDPAWFSPGENSIQLRADLGAAHASSPVQMVTWRSSQLPEPRRFFRFPIHDDRWDAATRARRRTDDWPNEVRSAYFSSNGNAVLKLPDDLVGRFTLQIEGRGTEFDGPVVIGVSLTSGDSRTAVADAAMRNWWDSIDAGTLDLQPGPKSLELDFANDKYEKDVGDRNFQLQGVAILEVARRADASAPEVNILYPPNGHAASMADVVVAEVHDDFAVHSVDVRIDNLPTGAWTSMHRIPGRVVLPLALRDVAPGEHILTIAAQDADQNQGFSQEVRFTVVADPAAGAAARDGPFARAVHLLNRFGFGPEERELADILIMGEEAWLRDRLAPDGGMFAPGDDAAANFAWTRYLNPYAYDCSYRAMNQLQLTPNPVKARCVLWIENHFSTWVRKTEGRRKWAEHAAFWRLGAAHFADLLWCSATSPAMLHYLDQDESFAHAINENYAREIMELHTLGVDGGYSQNDVTSLAHLLAGWTAPIEGDGFSGGNIEYASFRFDPALSEGGPIRVLGMELPGADPSARFARTRRIIDSLAAHPSTAGHIAAKLAEHYTSVPADPALVADLESIYHRTGGDLAEMLIALSKHPAFWNDTNPRIAKPIEFSLKLARITATDQPWLHGDFLNRCGAGLFDRPTPDGYPEEDARYSDSNILTQKWRLAQDLEWPLSSLVVGPLRWGDGPPDPAWARAIADRFAITLNGRVLSDQSLQALTDAIDPKQGRDNTAVFIATLVAQLPETSLR